MSRANNDRLSKEQWQRVMSLFSDVSDLAPAEREQRIAAAGLSATAASRLHRMLATLGQTMSLIDTPLSSRMTFEASWFETNWLNRQLDEFYLHSLLQEGAIAAVFLAEQREPVARQVVIKMLRPEASPDYQELFRFEQRALAKLSHPNVAGIIDVRTPAEGVSYIVMEHIEGQSLTDYCAERALGIDDRLALFLQLCDAVSHCHQRGILHRDLKPSNVLVREFDGVAVPTLIDFGISSELSERIVHAQDRLLGTPEYMSAEHVLSAGDLDARADVYSLGMVLFTLLVGRIPFDRAPLARMSTAQRLALIAEFQAPSLSEYLAGLSADEGAERARERSTTRARLRSTVAGELNSIFSKAVARDRTQRYQSVSELAGDIRRFQAHQPVDVHSQSAAYRFGRFARRNAVATAAATAVLALGLLFLGKLVDQNIRIKQEMERAELERRNAERVASMMIETFGFADPNNAAREGRASVNDMLEHGYRNLMRTRGLGADLRGSLLVSLSEAFRGAAQYDTAAEIDRILLDDAEVSDPLVLCRAQISASRTAGAAADLPRQLMTAEQAFARCNAPDVAADAQIEAHLVLADALVLHDRYDEAAQTLEAALSLHGEMFDEPTPILADIYHARAGVAFGQHNMAQATADYQQAKDIIGRWFAEDHARTVRAELGLYRQLCYVQDPACTTERGLTLRENVVRVWADGSRQEVDVLTILANTNFYNGRYEQAAQQCEESLAIIERLGEEQGHDYLPISAFLSTIYLFMREPEAALTASARAYDLVLSMQASDSPVTGRNLAYAQIRHAYALVGNEMLTAAEPLMDAAVTYFAGIDPERGNGLEISLILRAVVYAQQGRFDAAAADIDALRTVIANNAPGEDKEQLVVSMINEYANLRAQWDERRFAQFMETWNAFREYKGDQAWLPPHTLIETFVAARRAD